MSLHSMSSYHGILEKIVNAGSEKKEGEEMVRSVNAAGAALANVIAT